MDGGDGDAVVLFVAVELLGVQPGGDLEEAGQGRVLVMLLPDGRRLQPQLKQVQEYQHADLATTARYIKNLPVPRGTTERAKLEAYLAAEVGGIET